MSGRQPPVVRAAVAFSLGALVAPLTEAVPTPLLLPALLALPIRAWCRPLERPFLVTLVAGLLAGGGARIPTDGCRSPHPGPVVLDGWVVAEPAAGRTAPFRVDGGACGEERLWSRDPVPPGQPVRVYGTRREGWGRGVVAADSVRARRDPGVQAARTLARWRAALVRSAQRLYPRHGPLVAALLLARREGLDPTLTEAFARAGVAHLLAISGFHVGVVAALVTSILGMAGMARVPRAVASTAIVWAYVALLGFPDAAARAAVILTMVSATRLRGRPAARWSGLAAALVLLVASDPGRVTRVGFQLSFAGAAGLLAWGRSVERFLHRATAGRLPRGVLSGVSAGVAATVATVPVVAWHFERMSLVGIPASLVASPVVALALPGALLTLALDPLSPSLAGFLAGGVSILLDALAAGTRMASAPSWASVWVPRGWIPPLALGAGGVLLAGRRAGLGRGARRLVAIPVALTALLVAGWGAALAREGTLTLTVIDVGQGDAILLRSPRGRWILVDAGPPPPEGRPGPVASALGHRGVRRLDALILTHPDLDHIGGARSVLEATAVGRVVDPALPVGKSAFVDVLEVARARGVAWTSAGSLGRFDWDGVTLEVLHPRDGVDGPETTGPVDANDRSVVLLVRWGAFEALLTGDAPAAVERGLVGLPDSMEVLKVGHHGSTTSTDSVLLARTRPRLALVSVGKGNRYGHPAPSVLDRLERADVSVVRTDRVGWVEVAARRDGTFVVRVERPGARR